MGEYQTNTTKDCVKKVCADPVQTFKPVEIVLPTEYNEPPYKHDIALIKLDRPVKYSRKLLVDQNYDNKMKNTQFVQRLGTAHLLTISQRRKDESLNDSG